MERAFNIYILVLGLVPVAYFVLLYYSSIVLKLSLVGILRQNPLMAVMLIIVILDLIFAYTLWIKKEVFLRDRKIFQGLMVYMTVIQLLVGNLVSFGLGLINLYSSKELRIKGNKYFDLKYLPVFIAFFLLYVICLFLLIFLEIK